jgi:alanyl-tRNA synthetase
VWSERVTERLYHADSGLLDFEASVLRRLEHEGRPAVVLDRTAFYAESGGQPWDTGTLAEARVVAVIEQGSEVLHVLDRPLASEHVRGKVDAERRRDHMQQHHGQHLLSKAFLDVCQAGTVAFHLGSAVTTIDLDRPVGEDAVRAACRLANRIVWQARPVHVTLMSADAARANGLTPPDGARGDIRVVEAESFDRQPCGGTHPRTTAEVGVILVTALERYKGASRVHFLCGERALTACDQRQAVLGALVATLSAPIEELPEAARRLKEDLGAATRRGRLLLSRALEGDAQRLLAAAQAGGPAPTRSAPAVVCETFEAWTAEELRELAQRLVALAPCVALLASRGEKVQLVFAQSEGLAHDVPALLRVAAEELGGKGGGRGNLAQGGGDRTERLDQALARARAAVGAPR